MKSLYKFLIVLFIAANTILANGLLMPENEDYPKDFLRNTVSKVTVNFHGLVAETHVYQEFLNESYDSTDAVYSFPLPANAKATKFIYWYNDKVYQAILKVREQATNPGTGEGGVAALVNQYIGRNGIKIHLKGIQPGEIQKVELSYISMCDYYNGIHNYKFPFNTSNFTKNQLDHIEFNINIESDSPILSFASSSHSGLNISEQSENNVSLNYFESKGYMNKNFDFSFTTSTEEMGLDFYSTNNDSLEGHFFMAIKPETEIAEENIYSKRIIFLLSNSSSMYGAPLAQSIEAIKLMLDKLSPNDQFNIVSFANSYNNWESETVAATSENINSAKDYLNSVGTSYGSNLQDALTECLNQVTDKEYSNSIILFGDGLSYCLPKEISDLNTNETGIFPIGIGNNLKYASLEMTAAINYGFVTYIEENENIVDKMEMVFDKISTPLMTEVGLEFGTSNAKELVPTKYPSTYAGSMFYLAGKYENSGESALSIAGTAKDDFKSYDFLLPFTEDTTVNKFAESIWAKMMIDKLEWEIELYGDNEELKQQLIDISLTYNIRCRYTAYLADYETEPPMTDVESEGLNLIPTDSRLSQNYPNPFNPTTTIRFYLSNAALGKSILLKVYNILGELVAIINLNSSNMGWNEIQFSGKDMYGNQLPSGIYITQLQIGNEIKNSIKMNLLK